MLELAEKILQRELRNPKKYNNEKPLEYVATYNKNNPELFTEIMKNQEQIKNKDKIKEILDTAKIIKSQRQPKNPKRILTSSTFGENTTQMHDNKRCKICYIIFESKYSTFKNPETKFKINKNLSCNSKNVVYIIVMGALPTDSWTLPNSILSTHEEIRYSTDIRLTSKPSLRHHFSLYLVTSIYL